MKKTLALVLAALMTILCLSAGTALADDRFDRDDWPDWDDWFDREDWPDWDDDRWPWPTEAPTEKPTEAPTEKPTEAPTEKPTEAPTEKPTEAPTEKPTEAPTEKPTEAPTEEPGEDEHNERLYHIDMRIDGVLTIENYEDGVLVSSSKVNATINSVPSVTYSKDGSSKSISLQRNTSSDNGKLEYMDRNRNSEFYYGGKVTVNATITYTDPATGKKVSVDLENWSETMTYGGNACYRKDSKGSERGYDVVIEAKVLNKIVKEKTSFTVTKEWNMDEGAGTPTALTFVLKSTDGSYSETFTMTQKHANGSKWVYTVDNLDPDKSYYVADETSVTVEEAGKENTYTFGSDDKAETAEGVWISSVSSSKIVNKYVDNPDPTATPTPAPTATPEPTAEPTPEPTAEPTPEPTAAPTEAPAEDDDDMPKTGDNSVTYAQLLAVMVGAAAVLCILPRRKHS